MGCSLACFNACKQAYMLVDLPISLQTCLSSCGFAYLLADLLISLQTCLSPCGFASRLAYIIAYLFIFLQWWWYLSFCCKVSKQDINPWKSCLFPCILEQRELLYSSYSKKAPFVVHKITIDYAFDQVFRAKMQSLHENFAPQILVFRHELPFFPSYFVWNPFFSLFISFLLLLLSCLFFLLSCFLWNPFFSLFISFLLCLLSSVTSVSHFLFSPLFLLLSPTKSKKRGSFFRKSPSFFWKSPSFFWESPSFFGATL